MDKQIGIKVLNMLAEELTVVIICYDPYEDAIQLSPFFLEKFWKNHSPKIIYVTSELDVDYDKCVVLKTHGDLSYSGRLKIALNHVETPYVLLLLDDYFLNSKVDELKIKENVDYMVKENVDFCQLFTMFSIPPGRRIVRKKILVPDEKIKYRVNLQPAIFKKELLEKLVYNKPFTAWDAELLFMSEDFAYIKAVFSLNKSFSVTNYIDKGFVTREGARLLKKYDLWEKQRKLVPFFKSLKMKIIRSLYFYLPFSKKKNLNKAHGVYKG